MISYSDVLLGALDQAPDAIVITEAQLERPGPAILYVNQRFSEMTGYSSEECLGLTPRILQGPRTDRSVLDRLRSDLLAGRSFVGETVNYRRDGRPFQLRWHISPIRGKDRTVGFVAIQRDITVERTGAAGGSATELSAFDDHAREAIHDLRNALTAATLNALSALSALDPSHPAYEYAQQLSRSAAEASEIAKRMVWPSTSSSSRVDVNALLFELLGEMRPQLPVGIEVVLDPDPAGPVAQVPALDLRRILRNTLMNAFEALSGMNGQIFVSTRAGDREVQIEVRDTGSGIEAEQLDHIWLAGFSTKGSGRGSGLASVHSALKLCGGSAEVRSAPGQGTQLRIEIPSAGRCGRRGTVSAS